jgi:arsenate reductase
MKAYNILFLCTHNAARSVLAEVVASMQSNGRLIGYSAGSNPKQSVHPYARELALEMGYPASKLRSKSWDEFARPDAPKMDFIITVCDNAAGEACPVWVGNPITAHWGFPDPSQVEGSEEEKRRAFREVMQGFAKRIHALAQMPLERMDASTIQAKVCGLGGPQTEGSQVTGPGIFFDGTK